MRRTLLSLAVIIAWSTTAAGATSPCPSATAGPIGAFREGIVDGRWVGVVLNEVGGGAGALSVTAYTLDQFGAIVQLGPLRVSGPGGTDMDARFIGGKMYLVNTSFSSADRPCCASHLAVQRFGVHRATAPAVALEREGVAIVDNPRAHLTSAQRSCAALGKSYADEKLREEMTKGTYR